MTYSLLKKSNIESVKNNIIQMTCEYLLKYPNIESFVFGLSGGADSALVCALAVEVRARMLTKYNRNILIIARSLPILTNTNEEIDRACAVGNAFSIDFDTVSLDEAYNSLLEHFGEIPGDGNRVRLGNIKARIRMIYLYNLAHKNNGIVLSTDNYTELLLGFWTLHGDVGDFGMIQNLWKTEVFMMLEFFSMTSYDTNNISIALKACREAIPTDGLGVSESDYAQFGNVSTYEEVDRIFIDALNNGYTNVIKNGGEVPKVLTMYERSMFKRENPYNIPREHLV
jgi:NAD+ synthase